MPEEVYGLNAGGGSGGPQSVQTQNCVDLTLSGNSTSEGAGYALVSSGTLTLAGGDNITLSQDGNRLTIVGGGGGAFTGGISSGGNTAGTTGTVNNGILFFGGPNLTLSGSSAADGATVTFVGPDPGGNTFGMSDLGNTAGTTGVVSATADLFVLAGGNNVTLSQSLDGASATVTISAGSLGGGIAALGNTAGTSGVVYSRIVFVGSNNITLSQSVNGQSATITILDETAAGGSFTAGVSTGGNTLGTTGTVSNGVLFVGGTNLTLSQSSGAGGATVTLIGPAPGTAQTAQTGISGIAGSGASTVTNGTVQFANSNGVTFGLNGSTITASYASATASTFAGGISNIGNTSGSTGLVSQRLVLVGGNNITLSGSTDAGLNSATVTISQKDPLVSKFYFEPAGQISSSAMTQSSASFRYVSIPYDLSFTRVDIPILVASTSSATTNTCAWVISSGLVIYSVSNSSTLNPITGSFGTTTHTFASNTAGNQSLTGAKFASFALATTLSAGHYYVGFQLSTANTSSVGLSTTAISFAVSVLYGSVYTAAGFNDFGSAANASTDIMPMMGVMGTTITATNQTINMNTITATGVSKARANFPILFRNY